MEENKEQKWTSKEFVSNMEKQLLKLCTQRHLLNGQLLIIDELNEKWRHSAPQYMADAVPEIARYPMVSIAWALYYGMGAASLWDGAWDNVKEKEDLYVYIRDARGFDNMDDYVTEGLMGLHPKDNVIDAENLNRLTSLIQDCAELALTLIRKEGIEPQSIEAFQMYAKTTELFFRLGVSLALTGLGYKYEKLMMN